MQCRILIYFIQYICHFTFLEITIEFNPISYTVNEESDDKVSLRIVKTGSASIPVSATVTTKAGTAQGQYAFSVFSYFVLI